jgi:hypothetical protein
MLETRNLERVQALLIGPSKRKRYFGWHKIPSGLLTVSSTTFRTKMSRRVSLAPYADSVDTEILRTYLDNGVLESPSHLLQHRQFWLMECL